LQFFSSFDNYKYTQNINLQDGDFLISAVIFKKKWVLNTILIELSSESNRLNSSQLLIKKLIFVSSNSLT